MESLYTISQRRIASIKTVFHRYLFDKIEWDDRLIAIKGPRGTGKTTMMLQYIKENFGTSRKAVYISLDHLYFANNSLLDFVEFHYTRGGTVICIDEVHKYPEWQTAIKNIYDSYPDLKIVYSGSSMLEIDYRKGDLSRRQALYELQGLSFREYLEFESIMHLPAMTFSEMLEQNEAVSAEIANKVKIIPLFHDYLKRGYYPFYKEVKGNYDLRIVDMANQVIESDMPAVEDVLYSTIEKTKRMLMILAASVPQTPKMTHLYRELDTDRELGLKMMNALERGGLLSLLRYNVASITKLSKPDKILLDNPNLAYALSCNADIGSIRESFFCNQAGEHSELLLDRNGDFKVDGKYIVEVGGKRKDFTQIANLPDNYLAVDDTEYGLGHRIPLWMFGLLY